MSNDIETSVTLDTVFNAIREERDYQDKRWADYVPDEEHTVGDWLIFMQDYLEKARHEYTGDGDAKSRALDNIRKVAALAVACMQFQGVVRR